MADDAGALLVRSGLVSAGALEDARSRAASQGGTIGEQLVAADVIADEALTEFYRQRLLVPQVNPNTLARLPQKVVAAISADLAIELRAIPVSLDGDNTLTVAMSDPSDRHAVDEISFFTGMYVVRAVATQMQIAWCLAHYYGHITVLGARLVQPQKAAAAAPAPPPAPPPRAPSVADKVEAARRRAIAPVGGPIDAARPRGTALDPLDQAVAEARALDEKVTESMDTVEPPPAEKTAEMKAAPGPDDDFDDALITDADAEIQVLEVDEPDDRPAGGVPAQPRARTGELRVPRPRAASIKPPMPHPHVGDDEDDEPMISIEADSPPDRGRASGPRMMPVRRRVKTDPPELAARAGEVSLDRRPDRSIDDQPRIIIDDDALVPVGPMSGELRATTHRDEPVVPESTIEIDDTSVGVVVSDIAPEESVPVLLERRRTVDMPVTTQPVTTQRAPSNDDGLDTTDEEVVVLEARKRPAAPRPEKRTQVGIGVTSALTRIREAADPAEYAVTNPRLQRVAPADADPTNVDRRPAPPADEDRTDPALTAPAAPSDRDDTGPSIEPPIGPPIRSPIGPSIGPPIDPPLPVTRTLPGRVIVRPRGASLLPSNRPAPPPARGPGDTLDDDDDALESEDELAAGPATSVMTAVELDDVVPGRRDEVVPGHLEPPRRVEHDSVDDGWGPPGTTIPPPLLGALPGVDEDAEPEDASRIPVSDVSVAPLIVAAPAAPEPVRGGPARTDLSGPSLARAFEEATSRGVVLIHALERAPDRDAVITLMIRHLAETHARAGFLAIRPSAAAGKAGELVVFKLEPGGATPPPGALRLDLPSTLQDVVGTRLPYRGPMHDDTSRAFLQLVLGACPPEILLIPVTVRERVVGILFGERRMRHTFDDQLALAARAAGMALERILLAKRGAPDPG